MVARLRPMNMAQQLPVCAFQPRGFGQVGIDRLKAVTDSAGTEGKVPNDEREQHDPEALVKSSQTRTVEDGDEANTQQHSGREEREPKQRAAKSLESSGPGNLCNYVTKDQTQSDDERGACGGQPKRICHRVPT